MCPSEMAAAKWGECCAQISHPPRLLTVWMLEDLGMLVFVFADAPSAMVQQGQEPAFCCLRHIQNQQQPTEG